MKKRLTLRWFLAVAATIASGALLAACGDDDEGDSGEASAEPAQIQITATGDGPFNFEVDTAEAPAGAAEISLVNEAGSGTDGQLVYSAEERTDDEVLAEFQKAVTGKPVADWFEGGGGPGTAEPGATTTATQELKPGTYWVIGSGDDPPEGELASITVTDEEGAELPETEGTVEAVDYSFSADGLTAGTNPVLLDNTGEQWHHFIASKMADGATIDDVQKFFETEKGKPPLTEENQIESTVMEGGTSQVVDLELEAGKYAVFCFIADKQGGPPHIERGMIAEVEVSE